MKTQYAQPKQGGKLPKVPTEAQEQKALFKWMAYSISVYPELWCAFHIANGGSRDPREAHNLKEQGVKPGVPDIFLPVARGGYHGLFIELKRTKGGVVKQEQREWQARLTEQGYRSVICKGFYEAQAEILNYLKLNDDKEDSHGKPAD